MLVASCAGDRRRLYGFTLVELLTAIAILAALVALLLPAVQAAREASRRSICLSRQGQVAIALLNYEAAHREFPPGRLGCDDAGESYAKAECPANLPANRKTAASGFVEILPQLEQQALYDELHVDAGGLWNRNVADLAWYYYDPGKRQAVKQRLDALVCPSDAAEPLSDVYYPAVAATANYVLAQGSIGPGHLDYAKQLAKYDNDGMFIYVRRRRAAEVVDGLSTTFLLGEAVAPDQWESSNVWTYAILNADSLRTTANPLNTPPGGGRVSDRQNGAFASRHPEGALFAFADGHAMFVSDDVASSAYRALSTIAGEELPTVPD